MTRKNLKTKTNAKNRKTACAILTACAASILAIAGLVMVEDKPTLDAATFCPTDRPLASSTMVLVDTTDAYSKTQVQRLMARVKEAQANVPLHGKLTILLLDEADPYEPKELVSLCNPGSAQTVNPLLQTKRDIVKRWQVSFDRPVAKALKHLVKAPTALRSPILEAIATVSQRPDFDRRVSDRQLIVISDMLQHSPKVFSHYQTGRLWQAYTGSSAAAGLWADLNGARIDIEYLRRPNSTRYQSEEHRAFWRRWFLTNGAKSVIYFGAPKARQRPTLTTRVRAS